MTHTTESLMALRKLAEAATEGPWIAGDDQDSDYYLVGPHDGDNIVYRPVVKLHATNNADFIAAANPTKVIELLDAITELVAERDALAKDAARYRWLRDWHEKSISQLADVHVPFNSTDAQVEQVIDAAIDVAMKETP